ncbi:MAG TPA: acetylglutamate kinase, partial [Candidatus Norongarragalinales archaeon]|nr:acetylglutamate kinase [Candidatus Norongarragalinales archaeon]
QVIVTGAKNKEDARKVSKSVAGSNLFKCAIFGGDPNWGRVLAAVGNAGVDLSEKTVSIRLGGVPVFQKGEPVDFSEEDLRTKLTESTEVTVEVDLCSGAFSATSLGCDMTYKYVEINSEYTSREHAVQKKAKTILDAFEYARAFSGKTMVLKIGGKAIDNQVSEESFFQDVAILKSLGIQVVLVHGGGPFLDREMEKANLQKQTVDGLRVTTPEIMALAEKVFARINKNCVNILKKNGVDAVDATTGLMQAHVWDPRLGRVGRIESVDAPLLSKLLAEGKVPVISSIGYTPKSMPLNLNADTVAAAVAIALRAEKLTILTDVDGVLIAGKQVSSMGADEMRRYVKQGAITEGMVPKIEACLDASINGVKKAHLINGTKDHSVLLEVFTRAGLGTEILA